MFMLRIRESGFGGTVVTPSMAIVWKRVVYECPGCSKKSVTLFKNNVLHKPPFTQRACVRCFHEIPDLEFMTKHVASRVRYHNSQVND